MVSPSGQYRQVQITSASRGKLILLLYQGAIKSLKKAAELIDKKDYGGKGECLIKAQDIVMELNLALDLEEGEIALSLRNLYLYIYRRLIDANSNAEKAPVLEALNLLENLYEAWMVAVGKTGGNIQFGLSAPRLSIKG